MNIQDIVGPDAPTVTNEQGGKQSHVPLRFDLIPPTVIFEVAQVLHHGAEKYGERNWTKIGVSDHLNHVISHVYAYLAGDTSDSHLTHAICRLMFASHVADTTTQDKVVDTLIPYANYLENKVAQLEYENKTLEEKLDWYRDNPPMCGSSLSQIESTDENERFAHEQEL